MKAAHLQTPHGMAAAAERIGEELIRVKEKIAGSAADAGDDLAAELRQLQDDLGAIKETVAEFGRRDVPGGFGVVDQRGVTAPEGAYFHVKIVLQGTRQFQPETFRATVANPMPPGICVLVTK